MVLDLKRDCVVQILQNMVPDLVLMTAACTEQNRLFFCDQKQQQHTHDTQTVQIVELLAKLTFTVNKLM